MRETEQKSFLVPLLLYGQRRHGRLELVNDIHAENAGFEYGVYNTETTN